MDPHRSSKRGYMKQQETGNKAVPRLLLKSCRSKLFQQPHAGKSKSLLLEHSLNGKSTCRWPLLLEALSATAYREEQQSVVGTYCSKLQHIRQLPVLTDGG